MKGKEEGEANHKTEATLQSLTAAKSSQIFSPFFPSTAMGKRKKETCGESA
jgi:hypothetical protein